MAAGVTFCLSLLVVGLLDGDVRIDFLFSTCLIITTSRALGLFHGGRRSITSSAAATGRLDWDSRSIFLLVARPTMAAGVTFCLSLLVVGLFDGDVRIDFLFSTRLILYNK